MSEFRILFLRVVLCFGLFFIFPSWPKAQVTQKASQKNTMTREMAPTLYAQNRFKELTTLLWPSFDKLNRTELVWLIKSHLFLSEPDQVTKVVDILISKNPKDHEAYAYLGNAKYVKSQKLKAGEEWKRTRQDSIDAYKKALEIKKDFLFAHQGLIQIYESEKNLYELRQIYKDLIELTGEKFEWLIQLCEIDTKDSVYENALKNCEKAKKLKPTDPKPYIYIAKALHGTGDTAKAKNLFRNAILKFPRSALANIAYADLLIEEKNFQDSFKYYSLATQANSESYEAWLGYAKSSFEILKYAEALNGFSRACAINKEALPVFKKSANILRNSSNLTWMNRYDSAVERCGLRK